MEALTVAEAVQAAEAVLTVAAALARYVAVLSAQGRRAALQRLPVVVAHPPVRFGWRAALLQRAADTGSTAVRAVGAVADVLVPAAVRAVLSRIDVAALVREFVDIDRIAQQLDVDAVIDRVDLDAVVARVDIGRVIDRVDVDAVVAKVDIGRVIDRVDVDAVIDKVDLDGVVAKVDIGRVIDRVDVDAVVAKVDIGQVIDRVDVDAVIDKVDLDGVVAKVDIDRVIDRVDIVGLARWVIQETDLPALLRESTGSVTSEMVRGVRDQGAGADQAVARVVDRLLRRHGTRTAANGDEGAHP